MHKKYDEFLVRSVLDPFRFFPPIRCPSPKVLQTLRKATYCASTSLPTLTSRASLRVGAHGMSVQHIHHHFLGLASKQP